MQHDKHQADAIELIARLVVEHAEEILSTTPPAIPPTGDPAR